MRLLSRLPALALALATGLTLGAPAHAAIVTLDKDFDFSMDTGAPVANLLAHVNYTYDTTVFGASTINSFASNLPTAYTSSVGFIHGNGTFEGILFGNHCSSFCAFSVPESFEFNYYIDRGNPAFFSANIKDSEGNFYHGSLVSFTDHVPGFNPAPEAAVPEPATLALLGAGIAGLALTRRRARKG